MSLQHSLPKRRRVSKMGVIERAPRRVWPRHRRYVKSFGCSVPGCSHDAVIDFAHLKTVGAGGHDSEAISLCRVHHTEQHTIGIDSFAAKYEFNPWAMAAEFTRTSPDQAMREAMKEHGI